MTLPFGPPELAPPPIAKPTILDRLLGRLFPTAQYTGLLDPAAQQAYQRQGLQQLSRNLLVAGGASPMQRGTLANIGAALGGVDTNALADRALQLQAYRQQQADEQAIADVTSQVTSGGSPYDQITSLLPKLTALGPKGIRAAAALSSVADALKSPGRAAREPIQVHDVRDNVIGSPTHGLTGTVFLDPDTMQRVGFQPQVQKPEAGTTLPAAQRAKFAQSADLGAAAVAAWRPVDKIRRDNPGVEQEVGKILTDPKFAEAVPGFRSSQDAVSAVARAGGSAAAQKYMRAKWSFLDYVMRTRYPGSRISGALFSQIQNELMPGLDVESNAQMKQNEIQALLTAQGESGYDVDPSFWNNATKRHGVADFDLQDVLSGGTGDTRLKQIQGRY